MTITLTTPRLILRLPKASDLPACVAFWSSERSHMMGGPWTPEKTKAEMDDLSAQWNKHGFCPFIVTLKGSDDPVGLIGPFFPDDYFEPELGWSLWDAALEGQGLALEAATAARDWFFANTTYKTAVSYTHPANHRSHRLCEKLGAVLDPDARSPYPPPEVIYRHHAPQDAKMTDATTRAASVLKDHRASIDRLDAILVYTLAERFKHTQAVGQLKAEHDLPPSDPAREARQIERLERLAQDANLDPEFAKKFLTFIISEVIRHHEKLQK
jgi:chorismate mutase